MSKSEQSITPEEIRSIRESLRLTQVEAGSVVGGGPNAFAKYEAGTVKPSAAVIKLLRLLEDSPGLISRLGGEERRPANSVSNSPFAVAGADISLLSDEGFVDLLRRLLSAEATAYDIPLDGLHVASNIYAPDGGVDGHIIWEGGPERTRFLPSRRNRFQLKSGPITPSRAAKDVVSKSGSVKGEVQSVLLEGGNYIMLCAHSYTGKQVGQRREAVRYEIRRAGICVDDLQVDFRDSDQIASWVNDHPSVSLWVREQVRPGLTGPFRTWDHWARRPQHQQSSWVADNRLPEFRTRLRDLITAECQTVRVVGLSGIGKSRLVLESLSLFRHLVMYAVESEVSSETLCGVVQDLADTGQPAIVVVDECKPETHRMLASMVVRIGSRLSLVTIDNQVSTGTLDATAIEVEEAPVPVIEAIIDRALPELHLEDRGTLLHLAGGFPEVALRIGRAWAMGVPVSQVAEDLIETFVLGGQPKESTLLLKSAMLMAAFGLVPVDPPDDKQLKDVARLGRGLSIEDLHVAVVELIERGVGQRRGRYATLQPRPIALGLAERQWKEWTKSRWDDVLAGNLNSELRRGAARQLAMLNTTVVAREVVDHVCRFGGPFDGSSAALEATNAEVLSILAEIDSQAVAEQIERSLQEVKDLSVVCGHAQRHLVGALEKVAFHESTFEVGAILLLRLASAERKNCAEDDDDRLNLLLGGRQASEPFCALFPVLLGKTEANGKQRLDFLEAVVSSDATAQGAVIVQALIAGSELHHFSRIVGVEIQGSRPALNSWRPKTDEELFSYVEGCVNLLTGFAVQDDHAGATARDGLSSMLSSLILQGYMDAVETAVNRVAASVDYWPGAMRRLGAMLASDAEKMEEDDLKRVRELFESLQPKGLGSRTRALITEGLWGNIWDRKLDIESRQRHQKGAVGELASELIDEPTTLIARLPELTCGRQSLARDLGEAIAQRSSNPLEWLEPIVQSIEDTAEKDRNFDLLAGFVTGLADVNPDAVEDFKRRAAQSIELSPVFPMLCLRKGVSTDDIHLAIEAVQDGSLRPRGLKRWAIQGAFAEVPSTDLATLLNVMSDHSEESLAAAILLLGVHCMASTDRTQCFLPQVVRIAQNAPRWDAQADWDEHDGWGDPELARHHFEKVISYFLAKGRDDTGAREVALALAEAFAMGNDLHDSLLTKSLLSRLLKEFAGIAWPIMGHAIASGGHQEKRFEFILGDQFAIDRQPQPLILDLPEDILFAWCRSAPDRAPAFAARVVPVLENDQLETTHRALHPIIVRLLNEFGEKEDVQQAVARNIHTFGWSGSMAPHFASFEEPLTQLKSHAKIEIRLWAGRLLRELRASITSARHQDAERLAQPY